MPKSKIPKDKKSKSSLQKRSEVHSSKVSVNPEKNEGITENAKEEVKEHVSKDPRAVEIILDVIENVKSPHQTSYVHVKSEYDGVVVDVSEKTLIIDEKVKLNWSFYIDIDAQSEKDLDGLVSKPLTFTIYRTVGEVDNEYMNQMHLIEDTRIDSRASFDSAVSIYEAFTGEVVKEKELLTVKKKKKKKKSVSDKSSEKTKKSDKHSTKSKEKSKGKKSERSPSKSKKGDELTSSSKTSQKSDAAAFAIGVATMDMLPLVLGNQTFNDSLDLKPITSYVDDRMITYKNIPKMSVKVVIDKPITFQSKPTILSFTVESIYNIPRIMISQDMDCRICAWLPLTDNFNKKHILGNAVLKEEYVDYQMKAWPNIPVIGDNINSTKYRVRGNFDNVRYDSKNNICNVIKKERPRLVYNYIKRHIMTSLNKTTLYNYLLRYRSIFLEIYMIDKDALPHLNDKRGKSATNLSKAGDIRKRAKSSGFLHLMALVDISSLVYPGVTSTRVACQLSTYHEKEVQRATGVRDSYFMPKPKSVDNLRLPPIEKSVKKVESEKNLKKKRGTSSASSSVKKKKKKKAKSLVNMNLKSQLPPPPAVEVEEEPSTKIFNEDGDPTIIIIEIEIAEPLVLARPPEDLILNLQELIPVKHNLPKVALSFKAVEENYRNIVLDISKSLNENLKKYLQEKKLCQCSSQGDFLTYLRRLGLYQQYMVSLRNAISTLITKKFGTMDVTLRKNNKKHQDMIGNFFVYLVSQVNTILNKQLCSVTGFQKEGPLTSLDSTLLYAKEACELKQYTTAEKYFMERLCLEEQNPDVWFDYAIFQLEMDSPELAFEYLNEALSRKLNHLNSLLLYGILLVDKGKLSDAETCFMTVLVHRPRWVEGWGILFLFYQKNNNAGGMAFAEDKAQQYLADERTEQDYFMKSDDLVWASEILPRTIFFKTAAFLLKLRMYYWVEDALSFEIAKHPGKVNYMLAAICYFQENYDHALEHLKEAKLLEGWNYGIVELTGHCHMWKHRYEEAKEQFMYVLNSFDRPEDMHMLYVHCAKVLSILNEEQEARKIVLKACKNNPTPHTWIVAGTFYYNENDLLSAEECFTEANICNNRIPEVWGFLTLINLKLDKEIEAELCYQQALKHELDDAQLMSAICEEIKNFQKRNYDSEAQFSLE
ncbi:hypothetical protein WA026_014034 [Henosepilachna vigintioctopunctata]|uniref:Uncharacterized protein n=1 Tax=Henosepilachna vigintioctopunctata TaxID=420089 RepID=A0AAW1UBJ4_9CUCU